MAQDPNESAKSLTYASDQTRGAEGFTATVLVSLFFLAFVVLAWMPRFASIGSTDVGLGAACLAGLAVVLPFVPKHGLHDSISVGYRRLIIVLLGFLLLWGYLGVYSVESPLRSGRLFLSLGQGIIIIAILSRVRSVAMMRIPVWISIFMLVTGVVLGVLGSAGNGAGDLVFQPTSDRSSGFFKNPNQYGMIMTLMVPFFVVQMINGQHRALSTVMVFIVLGGLALSGSKTNILIGVLFFLLSLTYSMVTTRKVFVLLFVLPLLVVFVLYFGLPVLEFVNPRAARILGGYLESGGQGASTVSQRFELWDYSLKVMSNSPLFGEGTGQKISVVGQHHSHSHNVFMDYGRTIGVPGMIAMFLLLSTSTILAIRTLNQLAFVDHIASVNREGRLVVVGACFAVLSYTLSNQMSDSFGPSTSVFYWLCLGIVLNRHVLVFDRPEIHSNPEQISTRV